MLYNHGITQSLTSSQQQAQVVQAKISGPGGNSKYDSVLTTFIPYLIDRHARKRKNGSKGQGKTRPSTPAQQRKVRVVLAKVEGQQQQQKKSKGKKKRSN